jgi:hypothetical protein
VIKKLKILLTVAGTCGGTLWAHDSLTVVSRHLPSTLLFGQVYANPAAMLWQPYTGAGSVEASCAYSRQETCHLLREGEGGRTLGLSTEGMAKRAQVTLWGNASYGYRQRERVQWSSVSDYFRMGAYQIADSIGGRTYGESYRLLGGLAATTGRWTWAGEMDYRAGNDYRRNDPRPKTIVSDLSAKLGASTPLRRYQAGATLSGGTYRQNVSINIMATNNNEKAYIYAMRGFGLYDLLHSEYTSSFSWQYRGASYGASLFLLPRGGEGWMLHGALGRENMESLSEPATANSRYPYLLRTLSANALAGYKVRSSAAASVLKLAWESQKSTGSERLYKLMTPEGATMSEYHLLSESDKYHRTLMRLTLSGLHERYGNRLSRWLQLDAGLSRYAEEYALPAYAVRYAHATLQAAGGAERTWRKWALAAEATLGYRQLAAKEEALPHDSYVFAQSMLPDLEAMAASPLYGSLKATCERDFVGSARWYVSAQASGACHRRRYALWGAAAVGVRL